MRMILLTLINQGVNACRTEWLCIPSSYNFESVDKDERKVYLINLHFEKWNGEDFETTLLQPGRILADKTVTFSISFSSDARMLFIFRGRLTGINASGVQEISMLKTTECCLCSQVAGEKSNDLIARLLQGEPYVRRVMLESGSFAAIPSLGPLARGHTLLCPK